MKKITLKLIPFLLFFQLQTLGAATITSRAGGGWSVFSTWEGFVVPQAGDHVVIAAGHTVVLNDARSCSNLQVNGSLTVQTGGNLSQSGATSVAGSLNLNGGTMNFASVITVTGTVSFTSGNYTFSSGGFSGSGTTQTSSSTITFNTGSNLTDNLTVNGATLQGTLDISVQNLTINGGTYGSSGTTTINGNLSVGGGTYGPSGTTTISGNLSVSGGTFSPGDLATVSGTLSWSGGSIGSSTGTASTVDVDGAATISGVSKTFVKKTLNLNGGGTWTAGSITTSGSSVLNVPAGQSFTFSAASSLTFGSSSGTLNVEGSLIKQGSGTLNLLLSAFDNSGIIDLQEGTLDVNGSFTQTGTVQGVGTLDVSGASWSNTGTFLPGSSPGILSVTGNFANNGGSLDIEIGGTTAGSEHDRLVVAGTATLSGTGAINLSLVNGYVPELGHSFTILDATSMSGTYATPTNPFVFEGYNWGITYNNAQGTITLEVLSLLPVELVDFQGKSEGGGTATVTWRTASEADNKGFYIEKSEDGMTFRELGFVEGKGNSLLPADYEFVDDRFSASAYYRLRQIDYAGNMEHSNVIFLELKETESTIIFPNPATSEVVVQFSQSQSWCVVQVSSITGQLLAEEKATVTITQKTINISGLPCGIYSVRVQTDGGFSTHCLNKI